MDEAPEALPGEILQHYERGLEENRLDSPTGRLESERTKIILARYLSDPPARIWDIGGGAGHYALWLAQLGYEVHLLDPVSLHLEQARAASNAQKAAPLAGTYLGDARKLPADDADADAVLLLGPLYHLSTIEDRVAALRESYRVLRPGGWLFAVGISRFASTLDGMREGHLSDPSFVEIAKIDLLTGQHRNPIGHPAYFTTAFFHHPNELRAEIETAGFANLRMFAVEGPAWLLGDLADLWEDESIRMKLLDAISWIEEENTLIGASAHFMAIARRPDLVVTT